MRIIITIFIFLQIGVVADSVLNQLDSKLTTIVHSEVEKMIGRDRDSTLIKDTNSFTSLYAQLVLNYDFSEDIFVSFGAKANGVLSENNYKTASYLRSKLTSNETNKAMISEASLNYDDGFFALNIGRQNVNYDWLLGSIDGALAMVGSDDDYSLRLFWFDSYQHLQYNYFSEIKNINSNRGMYGAIAKADLGDVEFSYFDYYVEDLRNIAGSHINYINSNFGLNLSYASAKALSLALYDYDEKFLNGSFEFLVNEHFFELGFSKTGKNGLLAMIQMGNFMFGQFYLSNQVDRENAEDIFLKYIYADEKWRFELISGATKYDNSFIEIQNSMKSYEVDSYLKYSYSENLSFDIGLMYMNVDERDPLQVDQALVMFNVVVDYENY